MPKDSLTQAVETQAGKLDPAQRGFVTAEYETWRWNRKRIKDIEKLVDSGELTTDNEKKLLTERHQLVTENASLFSHIMRNLKNTGDDTDEFTEFMDDDRA